MFTLRDSIGTKLSIELLVVITFQLMLIVNFIVAQDNIVQEPAIIVLHNDPQSLSEAVTNHSQTNTSMRLVLVCAAYGEPNYPYIRWSSPTEGIEDYSTVAMNDTSVVVTNDFLSSTAITISVLELCDVHPNELTMYVCVADNGLGQNVTSRSLLGNSSVVYSFVNESVRVTLATQELSSNTSREPNMMFILPTVVLPTVHNVKPSTTTTVEPSTVTTDNDDPASTQSKESQPILSTAVVAIISTIVVCTVVLSLTILASHIIVVIWNNKKGSGGKSKITRLDRAQTDTDSLYTCSAYNQHYLDQEVSLHEYHYIDAAEMPIPPDEKTAEESFAVYQCPAYGAHNTAIPSLDAISENHGHHNFSLPNNREDSDSLHNEVYQTVELSISHSETMPT